MLWSQAAEFKARISKEWRRCALLEAGVLALAGALVVGAMRRK